MKKAFLLYILPLICFCQVAAQSPTKIDSLQQLLLSPPNDSLKGTWNNMLFSAYLTANIDTSLVFGERAKEIAEKTQNPTLLAENKNSFGSYYWYKGDFETAMAFYTDAALEFEKAGSEDGANKARMNIGYIYIGLEDLPKAKSYFRKSLAFFESEKNSSMLANIYNMMGGFALFDNESDSAIFYYEKSVINAKEVGSIIDEGRAISGLGQAYLMLEQYDKARKYLIESLRIEKTLGNEAGIIQSYIQLGNFELERGNLKESKKYYGTLESYPNLQKYPMQEKYLYENYLKVFEKEGNPQKSYEYYKKFIAAKDSIASSEIAASINELNQKYETELKENEILRLQKNEAEQGLIIEEEKNKNLVLIFVSLFMVGVIAFVSVIYLQSKKRRKEADERNQLITNINTKLSKSQDELMASNKTKDKFFAIVAHDLRGPIASLQGVGKLLQYTINKKNPDKVKALLDSIDQSASNVNTLLDNLLKWALSQSGALTFQPSKIDLKETVDETVSIYAQNYEAKNITLHNSVAENAWVMADKSMVSTIFRNLISNAHKFTPQGGNVYLEATKADGKLICSVKDDGVGMSQEKIEDLLSPNPHKSEQGTDGEKGTGLGLVLCKEFVEKNGGKLQP